MWATMSLNESSSGGAASIDKKTNTSFIIAVTGGHGHASYKLQDQHILHNEFESKVLVDLFIVDHTLGPQLEFMKLSMFLFARARNLWWLDSNL